MTKMFLKNKWLSYVPAFYKQAENIIPKALVYNLDKHYMTWMEVGSRGVGMVEIWRRSRQSTCGTSIHYFHKRSYFPHF